MDSRRWWMTGRYRIENPSSYPDVSCAWFRCPYCPDRKLMLASIHDLATHYADAHMGLHGLASAGDLRRQSVRWENDRIQKSGEPYMTWGRLRSGPTPFNFHGVFYDKIFG